MKLREGALTASAAASLLIGLLIPTSSTVRAAGLQDIRQAWLKASDVPGPGSYPLLKYKAYPKFALQFKVGGQHCGGAQKVPFPKAEWKYGAIETLTRANGDGFLTCAVSLKKTSDAHALHLQNQQLLQTGIKAKQLKRLNTNKIGDEVFGAYLSDAVTAGFIVDFRKGSTDVITAYQGTKSKKSSVLTAKQFLGVLSAMERRI